MVIDYEGAWHELSLLVASKSQHGREPTLIAMAEIADRHRVPAGELARLLRLYGVEVERTARELDRDEAAGFSVGHRSAADDVLPGHHEPEGGHDGRRNRSRNGVAAG